MPTWFKKNVTIEIFHTIPSFQMDMNKIEGDSSNPPPPSDGDEGAPPSDGVAGAPHEGEGEGPHDGGEDDYQDE